MEAIQKARLEQYLAAERAILTGQSYTIGDRVLQRADLKAVRETISQLLSELNLLESKSGNSKRVIFVD